MNEVHREFLIETHENLAQLDLDLISLEKEPGKRETLARIFRTLHTIKGSAGFLGLQRLLAVAHAAETLLSRLRDGKLLFNEEIASALLQTVDAVRQMLVHVEASDNDGENDFGDLIRELESLRVGADSHVVSAAPAREKEPQESAENRTSLGRRSNPPATTIVGSESPAPETGASRAPSATESTIRVDVGLLDKLMTLVGELVLARNQIVKIDNIQDNAADAVAVQRLNLLTTQLQAGVMKTRMQTIGNLWSKLPRVVRDMAVACGKQAVLHTEGQETELDRTILEAIRDPLIHLVRNAVDHGIEPPAERVAKGKNAEGRLSLHAYHEGGKVIIEIADDGQGIDPQRVRAKAIQAKLITAEQADRLNDRELVNLVFVPGFSTTDRVTQFSGRGVGMDVVRSNIEKIGGTVTVESRLGSGTTLLMKIPLTLAIIPALTVTCGGDLYAIPQVSLLELIRLGGEQSRGAVELINDAPVYRLRGNLLPLVYLKRQLNLEARSPSNETDMAGLDSSEVDVVVLQADDCQFGLVVDAIHDTEEIVVKPLQKQLKGVDVFAGATILGDGRVALILDVLALARAAAVLSGERDRSAAEKMPGSEALAGDRQSVLLFSLRDGARMAIPLSQVARLEEFPSSAVESAGPRKVVQYRNNILPLIDVASALRRKGRSKSRDGSRKQSGKQRTQLSAEGMLQVVVCAANGTNVGLVVDRVQDITEEVIVAQSAGYRRGVAFAAVIQGRVTEFLDLEAIVRRALGKSDDQPQQLAARV
jgi:two-component system chemotaxis sensor kinase CheA